MITELHITLWYNQIILIHKHLLNKYLFFLKYYQPPPFCLIKINFLLLEHCKLLNSFLSLSSYGGLAEILTCLSNFLFYFRTHLYQLPFGNWFPIHYMFPINYILNYDKLYNIAFKFIIQFTADQRWLITKVSWFYTERSWTSTHLVGDFRRHFAFALFS